MITDIVPFMIVVDSQFVKVFSFDFVRKFNRDQHKNLIIENAIMLQDQEESIAIMEAKHKEDHPYLIEKSSLISENYSPARFMILNFSTLNELDKNKSKDGDSI